MLPHVELQKDLVVDYFIFLYPLVETARRVTYL